MAWAGGIIAALFIALASALLPGAVPASQLVGSAFNPATTSVALFRDESERQHFEASADDRGQPSLSGGALDVDIPAATAVTAPAYSGIPVSVHGIARDDLRPTYRIRPGSGPRAPPLFGVTAGAVPA